MIPLKDDLPTRRLPIVTLIVIVLNVAVYLLGFAGAPASQTGGVTGIAEHDVLVYEFGTVPCEVLDRCGNQPGHAVQGGAPGAQQPAGTDFVVPAINPLLTLLTSAFVHGSLLHLLGNMLFFWVFGNNVEDSMPRWRFLAFFLLGAVVSALAQSLVNAGSATPQVGASGAIAATIGGYLLLYPRARVLTWILPPLPVFIRVPAWIVAGFWIFGQIAATSQSLLTPDTTAAGGVAYMAHVAGFLFGVLVIRQLAQPNAIYEQLYGDRTRGRFRFGR